MFLIFYRYNEESRKTLFLQLNLQDSFEAMKRWVEELQSRASPGIIIAILGNKVDLDGLRAVDERMALDYIKLKNVEPGHQPLLFAECSAKTGQGVNEVFQLVVQKLAQSGGFQPRGI